MAWTGNPQRKGGPTRASRKYSGERSTARVCYAGSRSWGCSAVR